MIEFKKCPFCGCEIKSDKDHFIYGNHKEDCYFYIVDNQNEFDFTKESDFEKLVTAWNKRCDL